MEYEYKSIALNYLATGRLSDKHNEVLNKHFKEGWEYVDNISQSISSDSNHYGYGSVIVILRRKTRKSKE